jgi:outer membrane immunogenic protein
MKKLVLALTTVAAFTGSAAAADLGARPYTKAPAAVAAAYNWTGFYIFGGAGGGLWDADTDTHSTGFVPLPFAGFGPAGTPLTRGQRLGGSGWFETVGAGYDWQFNGKWVAGIFGDGQFGDIRGSLSDQSFGTEGREKLRTSYAAGVRLGYLVAPNVLSYVNGGYSGSEWSGTSQSFLGVGPVVANQITTPSFRRDGWFIGGGVENNLDIFGITAPGWFMKTEYRSAYYDRISLPTAFAPGNTFGGGVGALLAGVPTGEAATFKPWVQTISTSLVYRFNSTGPAVADMSPRSYTKAPALAAAAYNWTGFYIFGGAGGGLWNADSNVNSSGIATPPFVAFGPAGTPLIRDQRLGGDGWFGTVGAGYDWQFNGRWVAGIFGDGQFGDIHGSLSDTFSFTEGREKLRNSYAAGVRLGYLVAPNVLSYVNGGYSGSDWSGTSQTFVGVGAGAPLATQTNTPSFHRDGWFVGGGVENNLSFFGITAPGWFMKTEYRSAYYDRISLSPTFAAGNAAGAAAGALTGDVVTFKPWVQTISTSLVYRFNWTGPLVAKY